MNKGRTGLENFVLSKPTWEIMKIISEITEFISPIIFGAIFSLWMCKAVDRRLTFLHGCNSGMVSV